MRFGLLYEHQLPRPWDEGAEEKLISDALDQVELADRVGFDFVWEVEHHFLEEYSHSSASEVFLGACSQRTEQIRLGFGICVMPPGYQHPARIAEKVAMLDLVSNGRAEFGTGETSSGVELEGFGVDRATKREQWAEAVDVTTRMFVEEPFAGHNGKFINVPQRNVVPKPVQKPHPPLWLACSRRDTIRLAAEKGMGALSFSFVEPEDAKEWVDEYYEIIGSEKCVPAGFAVNPNFAVTVPMMVHEDEKTALKRGIEGAQFFGYSLSHYYFMDGHKPGFTNIWDNLERSRQMARAAFTAGEAPRANLLQEGLGSQRGAIGTPEQVRDLIRRYEAAGVDQIIFVMQSGHNKHEHICEALELFSETVLPEFAAETERRESEKAERLAVAVESALGRRRPPHVADPNYEVRPLDSGSASGRLEEGTTQILSGTGRSSWIRTAAGSKSEAAFRWFVNSSDDRRLERTLGSNFGIRRVFTRMLSRFRSEEAERFDGEIQYALKYRDGSEKLWVIEIRDQAATVRFGKSVQPKLRISLTASDFIRISAEQIDRNKALVSGRMAVEGDVAYAQKLPELFAEAY